MKYCPYCGFELSGREKNFCTECGASLTDTVPDTEKPKKEPKRRKEKRIWRRRKGEKIIERKKKQMCDEVELTAVEENYDGYYEDILPDDTGSFREGIDKELIKKIIGLGCGVLLIVAGCAVLMYLL